jgi:hypothetical protein
VRIVVPWPPSEALGSGPPVGTGAGGVLHVVEWLALEPVVKIGERVLADALRSLACREALRGERRIRVFGSQR